MFISFKKLIFIFTFNVSLFIILMIGIQNSSSKNRVDLILKETVLLPTSFIIGLSFIAGSITGSLFQAHFKNKD